MRWHGWLLSTLTLWICGSTTSGLWWAESAWALPQVASKSVTPPSGPRAVGTSFAEKLSQTSDPKQQGYLIYSEADRRDKGYVTLEVDLQMILTTGKGRETKRALRIRQIEMPGDGERVLVVFDAPGSIRGTALLTHAHLHTDDDQWLFLPALKRVKKITSRNKTGPFLGSEFSYEDLTPPVIEKYHYVYVAEETCDGRKCYVVDRYPEDAHSAYSRQRVWIDQARFTVARMDFFNRRQEVTKTLLVSGYKHYAGQYWKASRMVMSNLKSGRSTTLEWRNYSFGVDLRPDRDFTVASLRRAR